MTDVVGEVHGKATARAFVTAGFLCSALFLAYTLLSLAMPWSPDGAWAQEGYNAMFGISARMAVASLAAFAIGEYQDVFTFFFLSKRWGKRLFWLRSILSNLWSQLLDTTIFMVIAFAGVYETPVLVSLILSWWLYKVAMGTLYTPLAYLGVKWLRGA